MRDLELRRGETSLMTTTASTGVVYSISCDAPRWTGLPEVKTIVRIPEKPCNQCGRPAPYVVYYNGHPWGWRLCWSCVPK